MVSTPRNKWIKRMFWKNVKRSLLSSNKSFVRFSLFHGIQVLIWPVLESFEQSLWEWVASLQSRKTGLAESDKKWSPLHSSPLVSPGHNGRHDRFGRGLARERERWRKETGTRRRGKNRHWQKTDMTAWQANKEIYLINKYIYTNIAIHFIGRNSELRDWSWCWPKLFSVKWNNFKWSAEVTLVVWEYNICLISFVNPDSCSGEIS